MPICKIEIKNGHAYVFNAPDKPAYLMVPDHLVVRRFGKGERQTGFFKVDVSLGGVVMNIGDRVEKPAGWP